MRQPEVVDRAFGFSMKALRFDVQRPGQQIQAIGVAMNRTQAGKIAGTRCIAEGKGSMQGHRLRPVFNTAQDTEPAVAPERVVWRSVTDGRATEPRRVPVQDTIQQAHRTGMRNQPRDPRFIDQHGTTSISSKPWLRSRRTAPAERAASMVRSGRARAAGLPRRSASRPRS